MKVIRAAFKSLNQYLAGDDRAFDEFADKSVEQFNIDFFKTPIRCKDDPELAAEIQKLLVTLDIPESQAAKYLKSTSTVYGLLKLLSDRTRWTNPDAHERLDQFIQKISNFQLIKTLEFFEKHLHEDGSKNDLLDYMKSYDKNMAKVNNDFFTISINSDPALQHAVNKIFDVLEVPEKQKGRYTGRTLNDSGLTVHDFLQEVCEQTPKTSNNEKKLKELKLFIETIETKSKISKQKALLFGLGALLPIVASMPYGGFSAMQQIVTAALFTPIVSIVAVAGVGLYKFYQTTFDKNLPLLDKVRENIFILASTALKIAGYGLVIAAAATAEPVAAVLTAVAEGIGVIQEGFKLLGMKLQGKCRPARDGTESLSIKQQDARFDAEYSAKKKNLWVSLASAVALTALAVVVCLFPISGVAVVAAMSAIFTSQYAAGRYIEKSTKKELTAKFTALEAAEEAKELERAVSSEFTNNAELAERLGVHPAPKMVAETSMEGKKADTGLAITRDSDYSSENMSDEEDFQVSPSPIKLKLTKIKHDDLEENIDDIDDIGPTTH